MQYFHLFSNFHNFPLKSFSIFFIIKYSTDIRRVLQKLNNITTTFSLLKVSIASRIKIFLYDLHIILNTIFEYSCVASLYSISTHSMISFTSSGGHACIIIIRAKLVGIFGFLYFTGICAWWCCCCYAIRYYFSGGTCFAARIYQKDQRQINRAREKVEEKQTGEKMFLIWVKCLPV